MTDNIYSLPRGSRILVTGANGYIGSQITQSLLELGFKVRGSVRAPKPWLDELFHQQFGPDSFETVIVPGLENVDTLVEIMHGLSGVIHVASDVSFDINPDKVIGGVVRGTQNTLNAASRHQSIQRVVLTSSSTAALVPVPDQEGVQIDELTWNEASVKAAWDGSAVADGNAYTILAASKTQGERAAWDWIRANKPGYEFNAVLPNFTTGRILHPEMRGSTMGLVRSLLKGDKALFGLYTPQYFVDIRDTARLHTIALLDPAIVSQRLFAFAGPRNLTEIISTLRKLRPANTLIPDPPANDSHDLTEVLPSSKSEKLLEEFYGQKGWTSFEESLAAGIEDL